MGKRTRKRRGRKTGWIGVIVFFICLAIIGGVAGWAIRSYQTPSLPSGEAPTKEWPPLDGWDTPVIIIPWEETPNVVEKTPLLEELEAAGNACTIDVRASFIAQRWREVETKAPECKRIFLEYLSEVNRLELGGADYIEEFSVGFEKVSTTAYDHLMNTFIYLAATMQSTNKYTARSNFALSTEEYDLFFSDFYRIKKRYPAEYSNYINNYEENTLIEEYRFLAQIWNQFFDEYHESEAKYIFHIDPTQSLVREITDEISSRYRGDLESTKREIISFIRSNIRYAPDPNGLTDWVQPPGLTLFRGEGDCDDFSVLLASMFLRAGVDNVKFCFAATQAPYTTQNHATIVVSEGNKNVVWDATCTSCTANVPPNVENWRIIDCIEVCGCPLKEGKSLPYCGQNGCLYCSAGYYVGTDLMCHR